MMIIAKYYNLFNNNMNQQIFSLKQRIKNRLTNQIKNIITKNNLIQIILVVDKFTLKIISNLFKINQLVQIGVVFFQKLEKKRKILSDHNALYFIQPKKDSLDIIIKDFTERVQYKKFHVLFPYKISEELKKMISLQKNFLKYLSQYSIKQFYYTLFFIEQNVCTMKIDYFKLCYSQINSAKQMQLRERVGNTFIEILHSIQSFYQINIYYIMNTNKISERITMMLKKKIEEFVDNLYIKKVPKLNKQAEPIQIVILDRSIDPISPLLHDFHYEPMLFDLLNAKLEKSQEILSEPKQVKKKKIITLEEPKQEQPLLHEIQDQLYKKYRYSHLVELLEKLPQQIKQINQKQKGLKPEEILLIDANLANLYQTHFNLVRQCDEIFKRRNLIQIAELQQCLSTGIDAEGQQTSSVKLIEQALKFVSDPRLPQYEKVRLVLLCYCCIKLSNEDFALLRDQLPQTYKANLFTNMKFLGITQDPKIKKSTKNSNKNYMNIAKQKLKNSTMALDRYSSVIQIILPKIIENLAQQSGEIDKNVFGVQKVNINEYKQNEMKQRKQRQKQRKLNQKNKKTRVKFDLEADKIKKRILIIFFVGSISYTQIRAIKKLKNIDSHFELIILSDNIVNTQQYINNINNMKSLTKQWLESVVE